MKSDEFDEKIKAKYSNLDLIDEIRGNASQKRYLGNTAIPRFLPTVKKVDVVKIQPAVVKFENKSIFEKYWFLFVLVGLFLISK